jgi:hypothetical protein
MKINATTGVVTWTPRNIDAGSDPYVIFQVSDSKGTSPQLVIYFPVAANLAVPQYTSPDSVGGVLYATVGQPFAMNLSDSFSHSTITWSVLPGPQLRRQRHADRALDAHVCHLALEFPGVES